MKLLAISAAIVTSCVAVAARADDTVAPGPHPTAGSVSLQLRYGDPTAITDTGVGLGLSDFQIGLGYRLTDRWYVGATSELALLHNMGVDNDSAGTTSLRLGGEARYIFHQGTAILGSRCGPSTTVPRSDYIGVRGGVQSVSGTHGGFAEFEIGGDAWLSAHTQLGLYLGLGVNLEPANAYGIPDKLDLPDETVEPAPDAATGTQVSPYFTFGAELAFG
ncbi:MAG TPA: hypothetical protein VLX92_18100 [Kofleriaceae bacterium]|nr:hypothetical protein [Kofleriaceae bacterium]